MIYKVRLNGDDTKFFNLTDWNAANFQSSLTLTVQGADIDMINAAFATIQKMEVFQDEMLVATYTDLDTYDEVAFIKNEYVQGEGRFTNAMRIHLTRTNIVTQLQRLDEQINPTVDLDTMTLDEVKEYKIHEIGEICRAEISEGTIVVFPDGTEELFTHDAYDEINLTNAAFLAFVGKTLGFDLNYIPYHSSGHLCNNYTFSQIMTIYMTLQLRLTRLTTKCNMINCMIRACETKEDILAINWDIILPAEYQERYDEIMTASIAMAEAMAKAMVPEVEPDSENNEENE